MVALVLFARHFEELDPVGVLMFENFEEACVYPETLMKDPDIRDAWDSGEIGISMLHCSTQENFAALAKDEAREILRARRNPQPSPTLTYNPNASIENLDRVTPEYRG